MDAAILRMNTLLEQILTECKKIRHALARQTPSYKTEPVQLQAAADMIRAWREQDAAEQAAILEALKGQTMEIINTQFRAGEYLKTGWAVFLADDGQWYGVLGVPPPDSALTGIVKEDCMQGQIATVLRRPISDIMQTPDREQ